MDGYLSDQGRFGEWAYNEMSFGDLNAGTVGGNISLFILEQQFSMGKKQEKGDGQRSVFFPYHSHQNSKFLSKPFD